MRYKNLTITITLGCLSLVALAGLVMFPIADVISCNSYTNDGNTDNDEEWYLSSDNRVSNFSAYHKYPDEYNNLGWSVSASVSVSVAPISYMNSRGSASASASPSIVDPDRIVGLWEADNTQTSKTFYGNATVMAAVYPAVFDAEDREDYEDTPYPSTSLSANVQVKTQRYKVCFLESKSSSDTQRLNLKISAAGEIPAGVAKVTTEVSTEYEYTDVSGQVWTVTFEGETTEKEHGLGQITTKEASKSLSNKWAQAHAKVSSFNMEGCSFPDQEVSLNKGDCTLEEVGYTLGN